MRTSVKVKIKLLIKKCGGGGDQLVSFKEVTKTLNLSNASVWKEKKKTVVNLTIFKKKQNSLYFYDIFIFHNDLSILIKLK